MTTLHDHHDTRVDRLAPAAPGTPETATARERVAWMRRNSRTVLGALAVATAAAMLASFSFSLYSSSSANPGNTVTTGIMSQDNSKDGAAILNATDLIPGQSASGDVTITNVGNADGDFTLQASNLADTAGAHGPADLSTVLKLTVTEPKGSATIYDGTLAGLTSEDLGTWAKGDSHTYRFTVTFPSSAGNQYQGSGTTVDLDWAAVQS